MPDALEADNQPSCVAIHVMFRDIGKVEETLSANGVSYCVANGEVRLPNAGALGNVFINFTASGTVI